MPAMCEGCKSSIPLSDSYCSSCKQEGQGITNRLAEREAQAKLLNEGDETESNPLEESIDFPSRFQTLSYFFDEGDGVEIVQDLDHEEREPSVYYFHDSEKVELKEGALYEWALEQWDND